MAFSESFYEVAAQLIPVLFLAMVVEERIRPGESEAPSDRVTRSWALALLVVGETLSLSVVAGGIGASKTTGSLVSSALLLAAMLIVVPVLEREVRPDRALWERRAHLLAGLFALGCILITLISVTLL